MENVWAYLRANKLCNLVWNTYDEIVNACADAWHFFVKDLERIQSIGKRGNYSPPCVGHQATGIMVFPARPARRASSAVLP